MPWLARSQIVSTLFFLTRVDGSWEREWRRSRSSVVRVCEERWSYRVSLAAGGCGEDWDGGAVRKSNRRRRTSEKERIYRRGLGSLRRGMRSTDDFLVCSYSKLSQSKQIKLWRMCKTIVDSFLGTVLVLSELWQECRDSVYLDRMSLSPNTRLDRI